MFFHRHGFQLSINLIGAAGVFALWQHSLLGGLFIVSVGSFVLSLAQIFYEKLFQEKS